MPYSNNRWTGSGFKSPTDRSIQDSNRQAEDDEALAKESTKAILAYYERAVGSKVKRFGLTSFDMGLGMSDQQAFDACVENFGFLRSLFALQAVSARAKACAATRSKKERG